MLTPHHRKDPQLGEVWLAAENFFDPLKFFRAETMFRHQLRSNNRIGGRFGADHRQRTLTELKRDSTRLVNNSEQFTHLSPLPFRKGRGEKIGTVRSNRREFR